MSTCRQRAPTGHNGYIGSVVVPMLDAVGHEVVGLDSDLFAPCTFGQNGRQIDSLQGEIRDIESEASPASMR